MGLREKALEYKKQTLSEKSLALQPSEKAASTEVLAEEEWEKEALAELRSRGHADTNDLLQATPPLLDNYLIRDRQVETAPQAAAHALSSRVEALLNLIDLCKEIAGSEDEEELWSTVIYGLLGQIGAREAAIFIARDDRFEMVVERGFNIENEFRFMKRSSVGRILSRQPALHYMKDLRDEVVGEEKEFFSSINGEIVIPIQHFEHILGFIIIGRPVGSTDYHIDDLLYLKLFGEILGAFYESIRRIITISEQNSLWQSRENLHEKHMLFLTAISQAENGQVRKDILRDYLKNFGLKLHIFLLREEDRFEPALHSGFSNETIAGFGVPASEPWLWESRHQNGWYRYADFRTDAKLSARFTAQDFSILESLYMLPVFFNRDLHGVFLLFQVDSTLSMENLKILQSSLTSWFQLQLSENLFRRFSSQLEASQRNPLAALEKLIDHREEILSERKIPYSAISLQISNAGRLEKLIGPEKWRENKAGVRAILSGEVPEGDFFAEIFPGQFLLIISGFSAGDCWSLFKMLEKQVRKLWPDEAVAPVFRRKSFSRPDENRADLAGFLFD